MYGYSIYTKDLFTKEICGKVTFIGPFNVALSIYSLVLVTINQYTLVCYNYKYNKVTKIYQFVSHFRILMTKGICSEKTAFLHFNLCNIHK